MQIHVVQRGDTIQTIAALYRISEEKIIEANQLPNPNQLVIGQAFVIPITGSFYTVKPRDSLWSIANQFQISVEELAKINGITVSQPLMIGAKLYIPPVKKEKKEVNGYVEPPGKSVPAYLETRTREAAPYLTYLAPFSYHVNRDGTLTPPPLGKILEIAAANNVNPMMVVTNQEEGAFSEKLGQLILNDSSVQTKMLNEVVKIAKEKGFTYINFDFEYLRPVDREPYNRFLKKAKTIVNNEGWLLSTALAPKTTRSQKGQWYEAHDYKAQGAIVDFVIIMTYEWGYSGGPAMAVSPIGPVKEVLDYAISEMPSTKILMGQNLYGYDWTLPYIQGTSFAKAISPQEAIQIAAKNGVTILYDEKAQAPHFQYVDPQGNKHEVWFEDARSIQAKFNVIKQKNLRGISYWKLGLPFPQNWLLLSDNFQIVKKE